MFSKKLFSILTGLIIICGFNSNAFAEFFSVSIGIPVQHTFTSQWDSGETVESDGVSGTMVHVKLPIMLGIGYENYTTKIKSFNSAVIDDISLTVSMLDFFWLTPIPIVNFTIGAGVGTTTFDCKYPANGTTCKDYYEDGSLGSAYQWYAQLGYNFLPFLDAHLSYQSVTAKTKEKDGGKTNSFNGNVIGLGVAFIF